LWPRIVVTARAVLLLVVPLLLLLLAVYYLAVGFSNGWVHGIMSALVELFDVRRSVVALHHFDDVLRVVVPLSEDVEDHVSETDLWLAGAWVGRQNSPGGLRPT
jgi:hypothetical protein